MQHYHLFYQGNPLLLLPVLALFIFAVVFVMAAVRAWRANPTTKMETVRSLPLSDDTAPCPIGDRHD